MRHMKNHAICLLLYALVISCSSGGAGDTGGSSGNGAGNSGQSSISNDTGGSLSLGNEVQLNLAPGSLPEASMAITINRGGRLPAQDQIIPVSDSYQFGPDDTEFVIPNHAQFCYQPGDVSAVGGIESTLQVYYVDPETGKYESIGGTVDTMQHCVTAKIEHFSTYLVAAYNLQNVVGNNPPAVTGTVWLPTQPIAGIALRVRVVINDFDTQHNQGAIASAIFRYRRTGEATGATFPHTLTLLPDPANVSNQFFYAVIPPNHVTTAGIQYRIETTDNLGAATHLPNLAPTSYNSRAVTRTLNTTTPLRFTTTALTISAGFSKDFTLQAHDNNNRWRNIEGDSFAVSNSLGTTVRVVPNNIRFNATKYGIGTLTGYTGIYSTTANLDVRTGLMTRVELVNKNTGAIITGSVTLVKNQTFAFDALGFDAFNNQTVFIPTFATTAGVGSIDSQGLFTAGSTAPLTGTVVADIFGITDSVIVNVTPPPYNVGGTVSDLVGTMVLQNNSGNNLTVTSDGSFTFTTPVFDGSSYNVTVLTQPAGQICVVSNGVGAVIGSPVTSVTITCNADAPGPLAVVSASPSPDSTAVPQNSSVALVFSSIIRPSSVNSTTVSFTSGGFDIPVTRHVEGNIIRLVPLSTLAANTLHTITVTTGLKNIGNISLLKSISWDFTTSAISDSAQPGVVTSLPAGGSSGINRSEDVSILFSEDMNPVSAAAAISVKQGISPVAGSVIIHGRSAKFTPTIPFAANNSYTVEVSTGATDLSGNALSSSYSSSFSTGSHLALWDVTGTVETTVQSANTLYLGGSFWRIAPVVGMGVVVDSGMGKPTAASGKTKTNNTTNSVIPDGNGGWYIAGSFTAVGSAVRWGLARINADGSVHAFNPGSAFYITSMVRSGSTLYVAGTFTSIGGVSRNRLAALDGNSGSVLAWDPNASDTVDGIAVSGTTVYVYGQFASIGGQARNKLAAIDGTSGIITAWDPNPNNYVTAITVSGGLLYVSGGFSMISGQFRGPLAAIELATGNATSWNPNGFDAYATAILVDGPVVYVAGNFSWAGGQQRNYLAALDSTTGAATSWNPNPSNPVYAMAKAHGAIYMVGNFQTIAGQPRPYAGAVDIDTALPTTWNPEPNRLTTGISVQGFNVFMAGDFNTVNGIARNNVAAIDLTTGRVTDWHPNANNAVKKLVLSGSTIFASGDFYNIGGQSSSYLAALDVSTGAAQPWSLSINNPVKDFCISGNTMYFLGGFTSINGQARNQLAAIDITTGNLTSWNPALSGVVEAIDVAGSTAYVGGFFTSIGGQTRNNIAALDTTTGSATSWNPGANQYVRALKIAGSTLYAGGSFTFIGGQTRNRIAAVDTSTETPTSWNPNADTNVEKLDISGTTIHASGQFYSIGGQARPRVAILSLSSGNATSWNVSSSGAYGRIIGSDSSAIYVGSRIYVSESLRRGFFRVDPSTGAEF